MKGIEFVLDSETINVNEKNFADSMQKLEKALRPGIIMFVQNYNKDDFGSLTIPRKHYDTKIFSYGDTLDGKILMDADKKNKVYITLDDVNKKAFGSFYNINYLPKDQTADIQIILPAFWTGTAYNEGTFSPAGGTSWSTFHWAGTEKVIIGDKLLELFPEAVNALKFVQDAQHFELHQTYSRPNHYIFKKDDTTHLSKDYDLTRLKKDIHKLPDIIEGDDWETKSRLMDIKNGITLMQKESREEIFCEMNCIQAVLNLLHGPVYEKNGLKVRLEVSQVGRDRNAVQSLRSQGYPVGSEDYIIKDLNMAEIRKSDDDTCVAFLKVGKRLRQGEMYILPAKGMDTIVEKAFSKEHVKTYYPHGL